MTDKGFDFPNDWTDMGLTDGGHRPGDGGGLSTDRSGGGGLSTAGVDYHSHAVGDGGVGGPKDSVESARLDRMGVEGGVRKKEITRLAGDRQGVSLDELLMVLRYLPKGFLATYMMLIDSGVGERNLGSGGGSGDRDKIHGSGKHKSGLGSPISEVRGSLKLSAKGSGKGSGKLPMAEEKAIDFRKLVDRKLRKILREIRTFLDADEKVKARRCSGKCKRFGDPEFLFCPNCGAPMQEND